jgi:hypothetical protein
MSNDDYDDIDETADPVDDDTEDDTEVLATADAEGEGAEVVASEGDGPIARSDVDDAETLTVSSKEALRRQLEEEMERFLAQGGKIKEIPPDESADPPRKPVSSYGSKPI